MDAEELGQVQSAGFAGKRYTVNRFRVWVWKVCCIGLSALSQLMCSGAKDSVSKLFRCSSRLASRSGFSWKLMSTGEVRWDVQMDGLGTEDELRLCIIWLYYGRFLGGQLVA